MFHFLMHLFFLLNAFMQLFLLLFGSTQHFLHRFLVEYLFFAKLFCMGVDCHHNDYTFFGGKFKLDQLIAFQKCNGFPIIEPAFDQQFDSIDAQMVTKLVDQALHWVSLHYLNDY